MKVKRILDKYFITDISDIIWNYLPDFIIEDINGNYISYLNDEYDEYDDIEEENIKGILIIKIFIIYDTFVNIKNISYIFGKVEIKTNELNRCFSASSFNQPLNWDVSNIKDMEYMFCESVFNQPLNFNTKNVIYMSYMFCSSNFNHPLNFNTEYTEYMDYMFSCGDMKYPIILDLSNIKYIFGFLEYLKYNYSLNWIKKYGFNDNDIKDIIFVSFYGDNPSGWPN